MASARHWYRLLGIGVGDDGYEEGDRGSEAGADELLGPMPDLDDMDAHMLGITAAAAAGASGTVAAAAGAMDVSSGALLDVLAVPSLPVETEPG